MKNKMKSAFDKISASPELIDKTKGYIHAQVQRRGAAQRQQRLRLAAVLSVFLLLTATSGLAYGVYSTPAAYINMEVNPSVGLTVNRFGRVIATEAYNDEATALTQNGALKNKPYTQAVDGLLDEMIQMGYLNTGGLVSVAVQASAGESSILRALETIVAQSLDNHHTSATTEVYSVSKEVRETAHAHHMSPSRYLAIAALQAVDESVSIESCAGHSVSEIRELTQAHDADGHGHHHGGSVK